MGLSTIILPGYFGGAAPYKEMENALEDQGFPVITVPLRRWDWVPTLGGRPVTPILAKLHQTVQQVQQQYQGSAINLVGHSAGGWIARIYLGHQVYGPSQESWQGREIVKTLVTLGTPHFSQEPWTRSNLDFVNQTYPGAFYSHIRYHCVAGKSVYGKRRLGNWVTYNSYELTCGVGNCWGDGITPIAAAHLQGAENCTLDGVFHSPNPNQSWYGSKEIVDQWSMALA
jgi:pimeloyl-ACP methyl ester carboxylesterase